MGKNRITTTIPKLGNWYIIHKHLSGQRYQLNGNSINGNSINGNSHKIIVETMLYYPFELNQSTMFTSKSSSGVLVLLSNSSVVNSSHSKLQFDSYGFHDYIKQDIMMNFSTIDQQKISNIIKEINFKDSLYLTQNQITNYASSLYYSLTNSYIACTGMESINPSEIKENMKKINVTVAKAYAVTNKVFISLDDWFQHWNKKNWRCYEKYSPKFWRAYVLQNLFDKEFIKSLTMASAVMRL